MRRWTTVSSGSWGKWINTFRPIGFENPDPCPCCQPLCYLLPVLLCYYSGLRCYFGHFQTTQRGLFRPSVSSRSACAHAASDFKRNVCALSVKETPLLTRCVVSGLLSSLSSFNSNFISLDEADIWALLNLNSQLLWVAYAGMRPNTIICFSLDRYVRPDQGPRFSLFH